MTVKKSILSPLTLMHRYKTYYKIYFLPIFLAITMTLSLYFALWQRGLPIRSNLHSLNIPPMTWASSFISVSKLSLACNWYKLRKHSMSLILSRLFPAMFSTCSELWKKKTPRIKIKIKNPCQNERRSVPVQYTCESPSKV